MRILEHIEVLGGRERDWHLAGWYIAKRIYWLPYRASVDDGETYQWHRPAVFEERARRKATSDDDVADPKERLWRDVSVHFLPDPTDRG